MSLLSVVMKNPQQQKPNQPQIQNLSHPSREWISVCSECGKKVENKLLIDVFVSVEQVRETVQDLGLDWTHILKIFVVNDSVARYRVFYEDEFLSDVVDKEIFNISNVLCRNCISGESRKIEIHRLYLKDLNVILATLQENDIQFLLPDGKDEFLIVYLGDVYHKNPPPETPEKSIQPSTSTLTQGEIFL